MPGFTGILSALIHVGRTSGMGVMTRYCCCWLQRGVDSHGELDHLNRSGEDGEEFAGAAIRREATSTGANSPESLAPAAWNAGWSAGGWISTSTSATTSDAKGGMAKNSFHDPSYDKMADEDIFGEAGLPCSICNSETRLQTHFALPCR